MGGDQHIVAVAVLKQILNETLDQKLAIINEVKQTNEKLKQKMMILEYKIEALESYFRRNNSVLHDIPQNEKEDPV